MNLKTFTNSLSSLFERIGHGTHAMFTTTTEKDTGTTGMPLKINVHGNPGFYDGSSTRLEHANNTVVLFNKNNWEVESLDDSFYAAYKETYRMVTTMRKYNKTTKKEDLASKKVDYFKSKDHPTNGYRYAALAFNDDMEVALVSVTRVTTASQEKSWNVIFGKITFLLLRYCYYILYSYWIYICKLNIA